MRSLRCLAVLPLLAVLACSEETASPELYPPVSGQWELILHPVDAPLTHDSAVGHDRTYLTERNGLVTGYSPPFHLVGRRNGNVIDMAVKRGDGSDPISPHSHMRLELSGPDALTGSGYTAQPTEALDGALHNEPGANEPGLHYDVTGRRVAAMNVMEADAAMARAMASPDPLEGLSWDDVCDVVGSAISFVTGILSDNVFRPMGGCMLKHVGGGYYAFGTNAPGSLVPLWTQNFYIPSEWSYCSWRRYRFTLKYNGPAALATGVEILAHSPQPPLSLFGPLASLAGELDALRKKHGDYAILLGHSTRSGWWGIYVITEKGDQSVLQEPVITALKGSLGIGAVAGRNIHDKYGLSRASLPVCGDYVGFFYLIGTANVILD
jgi:hypothetical protein